ncbi:MAG: putative DNA primase [Prokaryotic dsDNA virus sp.]|nr:MAG: putative DNA primase [Prokaryotic dsDNA virus sp.]|tara:strand:- start:10506 stop:12983 length:2478 start_codon:yes stop_codon:yes gene_type:complete
MASKACIEEIEKAFRQILEEGQYVELRALSVPGQDGIRRTYSGFFNDVRILAEAAATLSDQGAKGVYFTPNPVRPGKATPHLHTLTLGARGKSTKDKDIEEIRWLLVDIDPKRPSGKSATALEKVEAKNVCDAVYDHLKEQGWPDPIFGDSGNGYHMMYRVEEADPTTIRLCLEALSDKFSTDGAEVDRLVFNPSRIWKVYGTLPRKGHGGKERPWRPAKLLKVPEDLVPVSMQQLTGIISDGSKEEEEDKKKLISLASDVFDDLEKWIKKNFPDLGDPIPWQGKGRRWVFDICPWNSEHTDRSAYILQFNDGGIAAGCLHENCEGKQKDEDGKHIGWQKLQELADDPFNPSSSRQPLAASTADSPNLTDLGNAKRLIRLFQNELLYCPTHGSWYTYTDSHWERDLDGGVHRKAKMVVASIFDEAAASANKKQRSALRRHALRSESSRAINSMISLASTEAEVAIKADRMDADPWLLNVANGTINLRTGQLQGHDRTDYMTKHSPIVYDPTAKCPTWDSFLDFAMHGDEEVISFIHRYFGYCLTGLVTEQVLLFMEGTGSNGKTTALLMIMHVLGDYAIQGAPGLLLARKNESHPTEVADLQGARFVANAEVEKGKPFAESLIKQLTGSDPIRARKMRQDFYEFMPTHKLCIAANHRPIIKGNDEGIWRRVMRIPWNRRIPADKKDPFFLDKLKEEAPGILRRLVEGCLEWQRDGLRPPAVVTLATDEYREEMDVLAEFMGEHCLIGPQHSVSQKDIYLAYADWCEDLRQKPQNYRLFNRQLKERDFETRSVRVGGKVIRAWVGIGLRVERAQKPGFMSLRIADA